MFVVLDGVLEGTGADAPFADCPSERQCFLTAAACYTDSPGFGAPERRAETAAVQGENAPWAMRSNANALE